MFFTVVCKNKGSEGNNALKRERRPLAAGAALAVLALLLSYASCGNDVLRGWYDGGHEETPETTEEETSPPAIIVYYFTTPSAMGVIGEQSGIKRDPILISLEIPAGEAPPSDDEMVHIVSSPLEAEVASLAWEKTETGWQRSYTLSYKEVNTYYTVVVTEGEALPLYITLVGTIRFTWENGETHPVTENGYSAYSLSVEVLNTEEEAERDGGSAGWENEVKCDEDGNWGPLTLESDFAGKEARFSLKVNKGGRIGIMSLKQTLTLEEEGAIQNVALTDERLPVGVPSELWSLNIDPSAGGFSNYHSAYQICDIDLDYGSDWTPMTGFTGTFDGGGNKIENLRVNSGNTHAGLFATLTGTLKNVHIASGSVTGAAFVGAICGELQGSVYNCSNAADVTGEHTVGGICGSITGDGRVTGCLNTGNITGTGEFYAGYGSSYTGGIVGHQTNGSVFACKNTGTVTGLQGTCGGINGCNHTSIVAACYNTGTIKGWLRTDLRIYGIGGLVGNNFSDDVLPTTLSSCYTTGSIVVTDGSGKWIGMLCGSSQGGLANVEYCRWSEPYTEPADLEGIGPESDGTFTDNSPFSAEAWPQEGTSEYWKIGVGDLDSDGFTDDGLGWWKSLGTPGTTDYPKLFWEE